MGLGQQALEFAVLQLELLESLGFRGNRATVLGASLVERGVTKAVFAANLLDRHAGLGLPQKANDLFFAVFAGSQVHHSPG